jgi:hypothetical protein
MQITWIFKSRSFVAIKIAGIKAVYSICQSNLEEEWKAVTTHTGNVVLRYR